MRARPRAKKSSSAPAVPQVISSAPVEVFDEAPNQQKVVQAHYTRRGKTEFSIFTYKKVAGMHFQQKPNKSITLSESAARNLSKYLDEHLERNSEVDRGNLPLIRHSLEAERSEEPDITALSNAVKELFRNPKLVNYLAKKDLGSLLQRGILSLIRISELRTAIAQLRCYLEDSSLGESVYQAWCEKHTWAFGNCYVSRDSIRQISSADEVDHIVSTMFGYRDIIELKLPTAKVLVHNPKRRHYAFSADVSDAIGQCNRYLHVFSQLAAKGLLDNPHIIACQPRATIVIGRSIAFTRDEVEALHGLNARLHSICVITYDQLLQQGEQTLKVLTNSTNESESADVAIHLIPATGKGF